MPRHGRRLRSGVWAAGELNNISRGFARIDADADELNNISREFARINADRDLGGSRLKSAFIRGQKRK